MKKLIVFAVLGVVMASLAGACISPREMRREKAARAAQLERERGQDVDVSIKVERNERRRVAPHSGDDASVEGERAAPGEIAAAMIAPEECPMVEGSLVSLIDLGDGAALEFVAADQGDVQIVRDRVLNIAVKHQRAMQERLGATTPHAESSKQSVAMKEQAEREANIDALPASHVAVVDVDRGARIIFVPVDREDLDRLNRALEQRAAYMAEGSCPANLMSMRVPEPDLPG